MRRFSSTFFFQIVLCRPNNVGHILRETVHQERLVGGQETVYVPLWQDAVPLVDILQHQFQVAQLDSHQVEQGLGWGCLSSRLLSMGLQELRMTLWALI